jgi:large-conductance mechanosensitive channel
MRALMSSKFSEGVRFGGFCFLVFGAGALAFSDSTLTAICLSFLSLLSITLGLFKPRSLRKPRQAWLSLGLFLTKITNPILLAIIYFLLITPYGLLQRTMGKDELRLKKRANKSNWQAVTASKKQDFSKQY